MAKDCCKCVLVQVQMLVQPNKKGEWEHTGTLWRWLNYGRQTIEPVSPTQTFAKAGTLVEVWEARGLGKQTVEEQHAAVRVALGLHTASRPAMCWGPTCSEKMACCCWCAFKRLV
jgi:hypothetical protein